MTAADARCSFCRRFVPRYEINPCRVNSRRPDVDVTFAICRDCTHRVARDSIRQCAHCGKRFARTARGRQLYCSARCRQKLIDAKRMATPERKAQVNAAQRRRQARLREGRRAA